MSQSSLFHPQRKYVLLILLLIVIAGGTVFYFTSVKPSSNTSASVPNTSFKPNTKTGNQSTKGETPTVIQPTPSSKGVGPETGGNGTSSANLDAPTGNFVNTHHPSLSTPMSSSCVTTVGAMCQITFTNTATGKTIPVSSQPQAVDSSGAAYWNWTPQQIGLTSGTWKITATATLNDQSKSASDAMNLEIQ